MADEPTVEQGTQIVQAGAEAAQAGPEEGADARARAAMRAKSDEVGVKITDDDIDKISARTIEMLREVGAFDPPPEPVTAPPTQAPPAPGYTPPEAADGAVEPQVPAKRSFAQRFMGQ